MVDPDKRAATLEPLAFEWPEELIERHELNDMIQ